MKAKLKTLFWPVVVLIIIILTLNSCATYQRCQVKFSNQLTTNDSVRVTVPVSVLVPRDSVVTSFVTDTTYVYKEIQQGRAKVIIERTNTITTVQARCDTVTITKYQRIMVEGPRKVWGVKPFYRNAFLVAFNLLIFAIAIIIFLALRKPQIQ